MSGLGHWITGRMLSTLGAVCTGHQEALPEKNDGDIFRLSFALNILRKVDARAVSFSGLKPEKGLRGQIAEARVS
eukprot:8044229-Pyramimonas_sp.AAC.3